MEVFILPYKKEYHKIVCPKCQREYQVLTPAYLRKMKDTKYGMLCTSCRAKVQWEELSDEQKSDLKNKLTVARNDAYNSKSDAEKKVAAEKRKEGVIKYWNSLTDSERIAISEKRSTDRKYYLSTLSDDEKSKICTKISTTKIANNADMSDEEKSKRKEKKQEERKLYWDNLTDEERAKVIRVLTDNNQKYIVNMSDEERQKRSKLMSDRNNEFWASGSDEEIAERLKKLSDNHQIYLDSLTDEDRARISADKKAYWDSLSDDEKNAIAMNISESLKKYWDSADESDRNNVAERFKRWRNSLTDEERKNLNIKTHEWYYNLTEDEKKQYALVRQMWYANLSDAKKDDIKRRIYKNATRYWSDPKSREEASKRSKEWWRNLSDEEREIISKRSSEYQTAAWKDPEYRKRFSDSYKKYWRELPDDERDHLIRKRLSSANKGNMLHDRFEKAFVSSTLVNDYYIQPEVSTSNNSIHHSWDYGVYDKSSGKLVSVVDLDGAYFHADINDYDGMHSREEYDEVRSQSVPDNVKTFIILELNFSKTFQYFLKGTIANYDEYIKQIFTYCRAMPFPFPSFTDTELIKSFNALRKMDPSDKYHESISMNTRIGDRLIQHFHPSIWRANREGCVSPYKAWYDDKLLMQCIENRVIYQSYINRNKILQGFNVSKIAPKVSVFSAGRAKLIVNRYLSEFDTIFDPFSGFSGRMLGALSCGKSYIGSDISNTHVQESNNMIQFLQTYFDDINAEVYVDDVLDEHTHGSLECLFTCPPYNLKEEWGDGPIQNKSCDEWIDACMKKYKCKRYVFVVDSTQKYKDCIVDKIDNQSHLGTNGELIVVIE